MQPEPDGSENVVRPWRTLSSCTAFGEKWLTVRRDTVELPSGRVMDDFFVWQCPHIVTVVPYTVDGRFVLIRQYRHALGIIDLQFPAGAAEPGEPADLAAARELAEETGYAGGQLNRIYQAAPNAHKITDLEDIFLAVGVTPSSVRVLDDSEPIEVVLATPEELRHLVTHNRIHGATAALAALLALQHLAAGESRAA